MNLPRDPNCPPCDVPAPGNLQIGPPMPEAPVSQPWRPQPVAAPVPNTATMTQAGIPRAQVNLMRLSLGFQPPVAPRKPVAR